MSQPTCFYCGESCSLAPLANHHRITGYNCDSCGRYGVVMLDASHDMIPDDSRKKARCLAVERALRGTDRYILGPEGHSEPVAGMPVYTIEQFLLDYPQSAADILDRSLLNLSRLVEHPADKIELGAIAHPYLFSFTDEQAEYVLECYVPQSLTPLAWCLCRDS